MIRPAKLLIGSTLAIAAGISIYAGRQASITRDEVRTLHEEQTRLDDLTRQLRRDRDEVLSLTDVQEQESQRMTREHAELLNSRDDQSRALAQSQEPEKAKDGSMAGTWPSRVTQLKECLSLNPESRIPEMQLLDEGDWMSVVKDYPMKTEEDYRRALSGLRSAAENKFVPVIRKALSAFQAENDGRLPTDFAELRPHFDAQTDPAILARWTIVPAETIPNISLGVDFLVTQMSAVVDREIDDVRLLSPNGINSTTYERIESAQVLESIYQAYRKAHQLERLPVDLDPRTLLPFAVTPEQKATLQKELKSHAASK